MFGGMKGFKECELARIGVSTEDVYKTSEKERAEIGVIEDFLPRQLDDEEIAAAIDKAVEKTGAESIRDMGRVMGELKARYTGQVDFGRVGPMVKERLS